MGIGIGTGLTALYQDIDIRKPPYSRHYPALAHIYEDHDINMIWRNIAINCQTFISRGYDTHSTLDNITSSTDLEIDDGQDADLPRNAPIFRRSGFRPIPFDEIGLYPSPMRASWPVQHRIAPQYCESHDNDSPD